MATATFRQREIMRQVTMEVEVYQTIPDGLLWSIGWALMRFAARLIGLAGIALAIREWPEGDGA